MATKSHQFALAVRLCVLIIDPKQCTVIPQIAASFSVNLTRSGIPSAQATA
jgi:hypothetical protein